jgi:hypothetical protein
MKARVVIEIGFEPHEKPANAIFRAVREYISQGVGPMLPTIYLIWFRCATTLRYGLNLCELAEPEDGETQHRGFSQRLECEGMGAECVIHARRVLRAALASECNHGSNLICRSWHAQPLDTEVPYFIEVGVLRPSRFSRKSGGIFNDLVYPPMEIERAGRRDRLLL